MNFILFIMFFITPPNEIMPQDKNTDKDHRVWTLQSTSTLDFNTIDQCEAAKSNIGVRIERTNTLKIRAWCIGKGSSADAPGAVAPQLNEIRPLPDSR